MKGELNLVLKRGGGEKRREKRISSSLTNHTPPFTPRIHKADDFTEMGKQKKRRKRRDPFRAPRWTAGKRRRGVAKKKAKGGGGEAKTIRRIACYSFLSFQDKDTERKRAENSRALYLSRGEREGTGVDKLLLRYVNRKIPERKKRKRESGKLFTLSYRCCTRRWVKEKNLNIMRKGGKKMNGRASPTADCGKEREERACHWGEKGGVGSLSY